MLLNFHQNGKLIVFEALTCIYKPKRALEQIGRHILVAKKGDCNGAVHGNATTRRNGATIATAEWGIDQLRWLGRLHLRVDIHVLMNTAAIL